MVRWLQRAACSKSAKLCKSLWTRPGNRSAGQACAHGRAERSDRRRVGAATVPTPPAPPCTTRVRAIPSPRGHGYPPRASADDEWLFGKWSVGNARSAKSPVSVGSSATTASKLSRCPREASSRAAASRSMNACSMLLCWPWSSMRCASVMWVIGWMGSVMFQTNSIMCSRRGIFDGGPTPDGIVGFPVGNPGILSCQGLVEGFQCLFGQQIVLGSCVVDGRFQGSHLQHAADDIDLAEFRRGQAGHGVPGTRLVVHQTLADQCLEGLPDRDPRNPEQIGGVVDRDRATGRDVSGKDCPTDLVQDRVLGKTRMIRPQDGQERRCSIKARHRRLRPRIIALSTHTV